MCSLTPSLDCLWSKCWCWVGSRYMQRLRSRTWPRMRRTSGSALRPSTVLLDHVPLCFAYGAYYHLGRTYRCTWLYVSRCIIFENLWCICVGMYLAVMYSSYFHAVYIMIYLCLPVLLLSVPLLLLAWWILYCFYLLFQMLRVVPHALLNLIKASSCPNRPGRHMIA